MTSSWLPSLNFSSSATFNVSTPTVKDRELIIIASIQRVKRGNKKYGKDEVFKLLRDFVDSITKENFYKSLELLTQNQSVKLNVIGKPECLLLPKENQKIERK